MITKIYVADTFITVTIAKLLIEVHGREWYVNSLHTLLNMEGRPGISMEDLEKAFEGII